MKILMNAWDSNCNIGDTFSKEHMHVCVCFCVKVFSGLESGSVATYETDEWKCARINDCWLSRKY